MRTNEIMLDAYNEFFGFDYVLPKMDSISILSEFFAVGAMENFGMITYRYYH